MGSAGRKGKTPLVNRQQRGGGEEREGEERRGGGEGRRGGGEGRGREERGRGGEGRRGGGETYLSISGGKLEYKVFDKTNEDFVIELNNVSCVPHGNILGVQQLLQGGHFGLLGGRGLYWFRGSIC